MTSSVLAITADDYGYARPYDAGIAEAAAAGALDGVSVMAIRAPDPAPLRGLPIELGLHLERGTSVAQQVAAFESLVGAPPAYLDGHHHCHAELPLRASVIEAALRLEVPVRGVDRRHRRELREAGVRTADRLVGRLSEGEPALPAEVGALLGGEPADGVTEWFVHPGHPDPSAGSSYDAGRAEDLELLLGLGDRERWAERQIRRASLRPALGLRPGGAA
jgi:predicted glycoside hydrolase/deacetylase ChbG (UPF0249 family)